MKYKIVVDKQSRTNPTSEKKEYEIDIEELRAKGNVYDSLVLKIDSTYIIRRLKISEYQGVIILDEPIKEPLENINIELFDGDNYIYLIDMEGNRFYAEYLIRNEFNEVFATRKEMNTTINQTVKEIDLAVNQKFTNYSTTEEMNSAINMKVNQIEESVSSTTTSNIIKLLNNGYLTAEQVNALVNGNTDDIAIVKEQLKQTITSSQMQIEITKAIEGGVSYLKNTLFTIDDKGMAIATSEDEFNALYNNKGMYLYSFEEMIAKFDVNGATITGNLNLEGEFITKNLRMMNVEVDGVAHTHIHWIGG